MRLKLSAAFFALFALVALTVKTSLSASADAAVSGFFRAGAFKPLFEVTSFIGSAPPIICLCVLLIVFWRKNGVIVSVTMILSQAVNISLKYFFARPRPEFGLIMETGFSFPSGHAQNNFALYTAICLLAAKKRGAVLLALAALISAGRLYLNVHYLTDVLGGAFLGAAIALLINFLAGRIKWKK